MAWSGCWVAGCGLSAQILERALLQEAFLGLMGRDPAVQQRDISIKRYRCVLGRRPWCSHSLAPSLLRLSHPIERGRQPETLALGWLS